MIIESTTGSPSTSTDVVTFLSTGEDESKADLLKEFSEESKTTISPDKEARQSVFFPLNIIQADQLGSESVSINKSLPAPSILDILFPSNLVINISSPFVQPTGQPMEEASDSTTTTTPLETLVSRSTRIFGSLMNGLMGGMGGGMNHAMIMPAYNPVMMAGNPMFMGR
jgi:hypothetical protein